MPPGASWVVAKFLYPLVDLFRDGTISALGQPTQPEERHDQAGVQFTAFDGMLLGKNLVVVPNRLIVQAWRASHWKKSDLDSILILTFSKAPGGGRIDLVHVGVPQHDHKGVSQGWPKYYWEPWKAYLKARSAKG
jgi:activator of HSP90 ATPase